jgi:uncharacterized repeat protein (TIGR01451 family)
VGAARTALRGLASTLGVVVLLGLGTAPGFAVSQDVRATSELVPSLNHTGFVTGGRNALYTATWTNFGRATLTNVSVIVTLPAGSDRVSTDPAGCTVDQPTDPSAPVVVTCPRDNLRSGDAFTQQVFFRTPVVRAAVSTEVTSLLKGDERTSDPDREHTDTFPAPPQALMILPTTADAAGACLQAGEAALATQSGLSADNPLITEAGLTGPTGLFCTPLTLVEQHRTTPTEFCGEGATCTTDIAMTGAQLVPTTPIQLTFTFVANNRNLTWYKTADFAPGEPVPPAEVVPSCLGATDLPDGLTACVNSRAKVGSMAVRLGVLWRGGPDPSWVG